MDFLEKFRISMKKFVRGFSYIMKKKQIEIENSINYLTCVLNKLKIRINENNEYNKAYNRLLVERAELRKKLDYAKSNKIIFLFKNNLRCLKFGKKEKLICDYFSSRKI